MLQLPTIVQLSEVRHYLQDSKMWFVTRYQFMQNGVRLSDFVEIGSLLIDGLVTKDGHPKVELRIVTQKYDLQSALLHVKTLRQRLFPVMNPASMSLFYSIAGQRDSSAAEAPKKAAAAGGKKKKNKKKKGKAVEGAAGDESKQQDDALAATTTAAKKKKATGAKFEESDLSNVTPSISEYFPKPVDVTPAALKHVGFSNWNPVTTGRKLQGDLFYLDVTTLESRAFGITASENGFFVNSSTRTKFDPALAEDDLCKAQLCDLLSKLSDLFRGNFASINRRAGKVDAIEVMPYPGGPAPWLGVPESADAQRLNCTLAEDELLRINGVVNAPGQDRDWNEEYQILYSQANVASENRFATLNNLFRVHGEFVEACQKGAVLVVDGGVAALNPYDAPASQMWMFNNIFFSIAANVNGMFDGLGGETAAHKNASHEITGIQLMRQAGVAHLHACAQCIVDYRGRRVVCQSVVPGLLSQNDSLLALEASVKAGAEGDEVASQAAAAAAASTSPHAFGPSDDMSSYNAHEDFTALTAELGKRLLLRNSVVRFGGNDSVDGEEKNEEMAASKAQTVELTGPVEMRGLLGGDKRKYVFELLRLLPRDTNFPDREKSYCLFRPELVEIFRDQVTQSRLQEFKLRQKERADARAAAEAEGKEPEAEKEEDGILYLPNLEVNVNLFVHDDRLQFEKAEDREDQLKLLQEMGKFLESFMIPAFIELCTRQMLPADASVLVTMMHERGINARYLGLVTKHAMEKSLPLLAEMCMEEMVVRSAKSLLRAQLAECSLGESAKVVSTFLNALLGRRTAKRVGDAKLWEQVLDEMKQRFQYDSEPLDAAKQSLNNLVRRLPVLRSLCLAVGITVAARAYDLDTPEPFTSADVLALHAIVRHRPPELQDIGAMIQQARDLINSPQHMVRGVDMLEQAMQAVYHIMGPHTAHAANAHQLLANAHFAMGDPFTAMQHTERAVLILERLRGLDHETTMRAYLNLSVFYIECNMADRALPFLRRSLYLERLIRGSDASSVPQLLMLLSQALQSSGDFDGCILIQLRLLELYEGTQNTPQAVTMWRSLAMSYEQAGQFKEALSFEKRYNKVLSVYYPKEDEKVIESNSRLSSLTGQAVQVAKDRLQAARAGAASQPAPKESKKPVRRAVLPKPGSNMPLSHVLSLINSKGKSGKK